MGTAKNQTFAMQEFDAKSGPQVVEISNSVFDTLRTIDLAAVRAQMTNPANSLKHPLNANNISFSIFDIKNYNGNSSRFHLMNIEALNIDWNFESNLTAANYTLKSGSFIRAS